MTLSRATCKAPRPHRRLRHGHRRRSSAASAGRPTGSFPGGIAWREIVPPDHRTERPAVVGLGGNHPGVAGNDVVGVDEVDVGPLGEPFQQRRTTANGQLIPAHVGDRVLRRATRTAPPRRAAPPALRAGRSRSPPRRAIAGPGRCPEAACRRRWPRRIGSTRSRRRSSAMASSKAPTPGNTIFSAAATWAGSLVMSAWWPTFSKPFCTLRRLPMP